MPWENRGKQKVGDRRKAGDEKPVTDGTFSIGKAGDTLCPLFPCRPINVSHNTAAAAKLMNENGCR
jgi:hypothetical protein